MLKVVASHQYRAQSTSPHSQFKQNSCATIPFSCQLRPAHSIFSDSECQHQEKQYYANCHILTFVTNSLLFLSCNSAQFTYYQLADCQVCIYKCYNCPRFMKSGIYVTTARRVQNIHCTWPNNQANVKPHMQLCSPC